VLVAGRYELAEELGRGGMGAVYKALDRSLRRTVAFKRMEPRSDGGQRDRQRLLFEREYRTLVELAHPHIVAAYDYGTDAQGPYYVMELLEGADMRELSPLPYPQACRYLREIAASLALLHARRLVHRDVTPGNVRVIEGGECKLLDFGLLAAFGDKGDGSGTPPCVPPEALEGRPLDQRADLYSLGALAYFLLTGRHAYPAKDALQLPTYWSRPLEPPSKLLPAADRRGRALPSLPRELDELVVWLLRLDSLARPTSAGAVMDRLDVILAGDRDAERTRADEMKIADSYLASSPFVGRMRERSFAKRAVAALERGQGAALLLEGGPGIGKSRLLREIALEARLQGATVLHVDAEAHDRPYATVQALGHKLLEVAPLLALETAGAHAPTLGHVLPELCAALGGVELAARPADPLQWRTQLQSALRGWFVDFCRCRPLLLLADNAQRCDHPSSVFIASLALEAKQEPLVLIAALRSGDDAVSPAALASLRRVVRSAKLAGLQANQVQTWVDAVFGDAPNLTRLGQFLHARSGGSPAHCMELLRLLVARGEIRYRDGTWVLPTEPSEASLPAAVGDTYRDRLAELSAPARELARALSVHRGASSLADCKALAWDNLHGDERLLATLCDELVGHGVIVAGDGAYRFRHESLREALLAEVSEARRVGLHRRMAETILARDPLYVSERLQAGLHLLHAGDEQGARMIGEAATRLARGREPLGGCLETLEAALALYRRQNRGPYEIAPVLAALGLGAYMLDRRLDRHTDAIVGVFEELSGSRLGKGLTPLLGRRFGTCLALAIAALRYALQPRRVRYGGFAILVQILSGAIVGLCGKATVCLDGPTIDALARVLEPLTVLGKNSASGLGYDYVRGLRMVTEDRCARTYEYFLDLQRRLGARSPFALTEDARALFAGGCHYVLGVLESFRGDRRALDRAAELDRTGVDVHELIAAQLRLQYHGFRGETDPVRAAFVQLEARAIESGHGWQVETWAAIAVNLFGGLWNDVIMAKRSLDETERLCVEIPSLRRYALSSRATYSLQRGEPHACIETYVAMLAEERPLERVGYCVSNGLLAEAHNQLGDHARALQICERALALSDPDDAVYYGLRLPAEIALCNALAGLGRRTEAADRAQALIARYQASGSPLVLGLVYDTAARIAFAAGNRKEYSRCLKQVELAFAPLGNPTLIARFRNLTELGGSEGGVAATIASMRELRAFEGALEKQTDRVLLARHILSWVMERYEGFIAYLFARDTAGPLLLAATSEVEPRDEVIAVVRRSLEALGRREDTTQCGTQPVTDGNSNEVAHTYLLSFLDEGTFHGEGAIVLVGRSEAAPRIRYELLQAAAQQLHRLRPGSLSDARA
jgi:tetratricopeptide (TPR) repeat protein